MKTKCENEIQIKNILQLHINKLENKCKKSN